MNQQILNRKHKDDLSSTALQFSLFKSICFASFPDFFDVADCFVEKSVF